MAGRSRRRRRSCAAPARRAPRRRLAAPPPLSPRLPPSRPPSQPPPLPPPLPSPAIPLSLAATALVVLRAQDGGGDAAAGVSAVVERHRAALHRAMSAMQAVVMQVNEEVRKLEAQLQQLQARPDGAPIATPHRHPPD